MAVGGAFLHLLVGFVQGRLAPHLGLDGGLVVVVAVVMHLAQALQRLRRGRPVVQGRPGRQAFVRGLERGDCAGDLGVLCGEKKGKRWWLCGTLGSSGALRGRIEWFWGWEGWVGHHTDQLLRLERESGIHTALPAPFLPFRAANIPSSRTRASERELSSLAMFPSEEKKTKMVRGS